MQRSTQRILTTHTGSLPRPEGLVQLMFAKEEGQRVDAAELAELVGRERVLAGSDCGFGTWVGMARVDPDVVWAKLGSLAEGARLASTTLWA